MKSTAFLPPATGDLGTRLAARDPRRAARLPCRRPVVITAEVLPSSPGPPRRTPAPQRSQPPSLSRRQWLATSTTAAAATAAGLLLPPGVAVAAEAGGATAGAAGGAAPRLRRDELIYDTHSGSFLPPHPQQLLSRRVVDSGQGFGGAAADSDAARMEAGAAAGTGTATRTELGAVSASPLYRVPAQVDRLVIIGETHTHPTHHRIQLDVIRALHDMAKTATASGGVGRPVVVGLEQFHRQHTPHLDSYIGGDISLARLLALTDWSNTWGYPAALYTPLLSYCRVHRVRVVGLNAPGKLVAAVARGGLDSLPASVMPYLPEMDLGNRAHFARFAAKMAAMGGAAHHTRGGGGGGGGGGGPPLFDPTVLRHYYEAETLWDEYMAESAATVLDVDPACRLVVLAGTAHVENRDGLPERVERRAGGRAFTVLPTSVRWTVAAGTSVPDIAAPLAGGGRVADWIWYSPREIDLV
ncbi:hypothetical protein I4F81_002760 [Pyropia yezoensis]|uniref:Uncharacterized protein n=1 Tax=Pyropia yezoensis TaxID=2788 RepID=A0ACC3BR21_PYRYE|nr:hypothetical protein I4F81_002760 [Neopyropia yezoensis]